MEKILCGVDLGGTKLSVGFFSQSGEQIDRLEINDHVDQDNDGVTGAIVGLVKDLQSRNGVKDADLLGIGIGVAAHIRFKEGLIFINATILSAIASISSLSRSSPVSISCL